MITSDFLLGKNCFGFSFKVHNFSSKHNYNFFILSYKKQVMYNLGCYV
jgi:hypothetical protein